MFGSIVLFAVALLFFILGLMIYNGRTELIHAYHQKNINPSEKAAYGKAFSTGLFIIALTCIIAFLASLFNYDQLLSLIMPMGLVIAFIVLYKVQKKYNGGLF